LIAGIASGAILTIMVWAFIGLSGAHFNPALSLALWLLGEFPLSKLPGYLVAQFAGSAMGAGLLFATLGGAGNMGANLPNQELEINPSAAFGIEVFLSFLMMLVIRAAFAAEPPLRHLAPLPIGCIVGIEVMLMGPIAGASMNPARAFGPTLFLGDWRFFWIYLAGPVCGIMAGAMTWRFLAPPPAQEAGYATSAGKPLDWPT
jgi:MIP family channel proteins